MKPSKARKRARRLAAGLADLTRNPSLPELGHRARSVRIGADRTRTPRVFRAELTGALYVPMVERPERPEDESRCPGGEPPQAYRATNPWEAHCHNRTGRARV